MKKDWADFKGEVTSGGLDKELQKANNEREGEKMTTATIKEGLFGDNYAIFENEGDVLTGTVLGVEEGTTKFGDSAYLILNVEGYAENVSLLLTSGLKNFPWHRAVGKAVIITYEGYEKSHKTGRQYKKYNLKKA